MNELPYLTLLVVIFVAVYMHIVMYYHSDKINKTMDYLIAKHVYLNEKMTKIDIIYDNQQILFREMNQLVSSTNKIKKNGMTDDIIYKINLMMSKQDQITKSIQNLSCPQSASDHNLSILEIKEVMDTNWNDQSKVYNQIIIQHILRYLHDKSPMYDNGVIYYTTTDLNYTPGPFWFGSKLKFIVANKHIIKFDLDNTQYCLSDSGDVIVSYAKILSKLINSGHIYPNINVIELKYEPGSHNNDQTQIYNNVKQLKTSFPNLSEIILPDITYIHNQKMSRYISDVCEESQNIELNTRCVMV